MKIREFNKLLDTVTDFENKTIEVDGKKKKIKTGLLNKEKIVLMSHEDRTSIINYLVKTRQPIVIDFLHGETDKSWLASMGYLYHYRGNKFTFLHTSEQKHKLK